MDLWMPPKPAIIRPSDIGHNRGPRLEKATTPFCFFSPAAGGIESFTRVGQSSGTGATISIPGGVAAGDLIVYAFYGLNAEGFGPPSYSTPSGFTTIINDTDSSVQRRGLAVKKATGSESGSIGGINGNGTINYKLCVLLRPNALLASLGTVQSVASQFTPSAPTNQIVTSGSGTPPLMVFGVYGTIVGTVDPRGMSPAKDDEYGVSNALYLAWKFYGTSPANVTVSMEDEGANNMASCYLPLVAA